MKKYYKNKTLVAAHRGNAKFFPENTLAAFRSALTLPVDMLETDLHMTRDGEIILMHDATVDRTTDGTGKICDMTLRQIKALDAGSWKGGAFLGERVPALREFLELVKDHEEMLFNIELKDYPGELGDFAYESCDKSIALLERYGIADRCVLNSFSGELLEYIDQKYSHKYHLHGYFPLHLLGRELTKDPWSYLYCICLFGDPQNPVVPRQEFDYAKQRQVEPWVYFPDEDPEIYRLAAQNGAALFTANDPARAISILESLKLR